MNASRRSPRMSIVSLTQHVTLPVIVVALASWSVFASSAATRADEPKAVAEKPITAEQTQFFERQIRPLLAEHCWGCHGAKKQEAGLRLDSRAAMLRGSDGGPVVIPGKPDESQLVEAVRRTGAISMPPEKALPMPAVAALTRWVQEGLPWPADAATKPAGPSVADLAKSHWSFQPLRRPLLPTPPRSEWARDPLDLFLLQRQAEVGLQPSPAVSRAALYRRLSLDLLGLPPAPEDVAQFVEDEAPDAVERLVDRLLASPRYGERWARHWLDVARYSDTKGYVFFEDKNYTWAYTYRDYVIESLNRDLPYDRFVTEQLAADRLDLAGDPTPLRALGFLTLSPHFMGNTHDIIDDRIDVVTRGLMGLTATCARCHDHKYDPIPQSDYYGLYGVFRSSEEPGVPPLDRAPPDTDAYRTFVAELQKREAALQAFVLKKHQELVTGARTRVAEYLMAAYAARNQPATDDFMLIADTNDLNPTMILRWRVYLEKMGRQPHPVWHLWTRLAAIPEPQFAELAPGVVEQTLRDDDASHVINRLVKSRFAELRPKTMNEVAAAYGALIQEIDKQWRESLDKAAQASQPAPTTLPDSAAEELRRVLYGPEAPPDVPVLLGWGFLTLLPDRASQGEYQKLLKDVESHMTTGAGAPSRALVLVDSQQSYDARVFLRGNPNRLGDEAPRQFLSVANPNRKPFGPGSGRLDLAREIVSPSNPLTARVIANRLWLHHFGAGIVRTPGDFGLRGDPPTHPELLDYLAATLIEEGWSLKRSHRRLITSAVYRQASVDRPEATAIDPDNRRWWRMQPRRLDFESFRDSLLVAADSLDGRLGGPSVALLGDAVVPRRTLYAYLDRLDVPSLLTTFDFPNPAQSNPQRDQTTVPPQSLFLMNNPFLADIARRTFERPEIRGEADAPTRVRRLYRLLFAREATTKDLERATAFLGPQTDDARWQQLVHALLMTNEFAFID